MTDRMRYCEFYDIAPIPYDDDDPWVHSCCGGRWEERPYGHYADCENRGSYTPSGLDEFAAETTRNPSPLPVLSLFEEEQ